MFHEVKRCAGSKCDNGDHSITNCYPKYLEWVATTDGDPVDYAEWLYNTFGDNDD